MAAESVTARLIQIIDLSKCLPWTKPWQSLLPRNPATGRSYRGINRLVLASAGYTNPRYVTYRQAISLGGVVVVKGEKGLPVVFWEFNDEKEPQKGKPGVFSKTFTVFNVEKET